MTDPGQTEPDTDFMLRFHVFIWSVITCAAIYLILRDAKRLADALGSSQITAVKKARDRGAVTASANSADGVILRVQL
jgi:hypothetical protein